MNRAALIRAAVLLLAVDAALALLLAWAVVRPREVVALPAARLLVPGDPDEASLRQFAVYFAVNLENYTAATFPAQERLVRSLAAADADALLAERRRLAFEAGLASNLFVDPDSVAIRREGRLFEATFRAVKRHVVADRLSWEAPFEYSLGIEPVPPTAGNPYGLTVRRLAARRINDAKPD